MPIWTKIFLALAGVGLLTVVGCHVSRDTLHTTAPVSMVRPGAGAAFALDSMKKHYSLPEVAMYTVRYHFGLLDPPNISDLRVDSLEDLAKQMGAAAPQTTTDNARIKGVFVTLSKKGKTRACWGNLQGSSQNLVRDTVYTTMDALKKDYRHSQIKSSEVNFLKPQVTVIRKMESINSVSELNPLKDGLMLRQGGRSGVVLPGEAYDSHHQLVMCKMKAGVSNKGEKSGRNYQLYRLEADVFK